MGSKKRRRKARERRSPRVDPGTQPNSEHTPRYQLDDELAHTQPVFCFSKIDRSDENDWGWHLLDESAAMTLLKFAVDISGSTWNEVQSQLGPGTNQQRRIHHYQSISSLCDRAKERLSKSYPEWGGEIFRFKLGDFERLWGFVYRGTFYVVWWDPDHKVYPI